ncbi:MAG: hypothetical protein H6737_01845 [Alphaproteobacteria bacterium]|nr:hypothetical protein [Alphaproteobacteria bacterium]
MLPFLLIAQVGCNYGTLKVPQQPLTLEIDTPEYGVFTGGAEVRVAGRVSVPNAVVTVENREVVVGTDGTFDVTVPIAGAYRNIDVRAFYFEEQIRERIPVFSGTNPKDAWPGGMGVRITPRLFEPIAESLEQQIDDTMWAESLIALLGGGVDTDTFRLIPTELRHRPVEIALIPDADGILLELRYRDLTLELDAGFALNGTWIDAPSEVGFEEMVVTARADVVVDANGLLSLQVGQASMDLSDPVLQLGPFDGSLLGFAVQLIGDLIAGIGDFALDLLLGFLADIPLGGPFAFQTDLLGTSLDVSLADLGTDTEGVWLDLGLGLGDPVPSPLVVHRPTLAEGGPQADVILALHEGLFASLVDSDLLDLVSQDLELGGLLGAGIGLVFTNLPGGNTAPDADGWCVNVVPGEARAARMGGTLADFATIYLPDLRLNVGITHDGLRCDPWLDASLALEATFVVDGSALDFELAAPDGAVFYYGATGEWDEAEVISGLGGLFDVLLGLAGSSLQIDLADLFGTGLIPGVEGGDPRITGIFAIEDAEGEPIEGLYAVGMDLL